MPLHEIDGVRISRRKDQFPVYLYESQNYKMTPHEERSHWLLLEARRALYNLQVMILMHLPLKVISSSSSRIEFTFICYSF